MMLPFRFLLHHAAPTLMSLALIFAATDSALALTFFEDEFTCPIGGAKFKSRVVGSYTRFGMRLDLKPVGALIAPIPFPVCPDNGFVMYQEQFSDEEIARLTPIVLAIDYQRARQDHTDHYLAAYLRARMGAGNLELANLYLRASWQAEEKPALLSHYRSLALEKFDAYLSHENKPGPEWWLAAVVAAELDRLLGHFDAVAARLDKLPINELEAGSNLRRAIEQIRELAANRNDTPQSFTSKN
jgi:hypothetical protein